MGFQDLTQEQMKLASERGNEARRSPELKWARANVGKLREELQSTNMVRLAEKYNISYRSLWRLLKGK